MGLFGDAGDLDVLGAYTLEGFGLGVDPVQRKLTPALHYGAATTWLQQLYARRGGEPVDRRGATAEGRERRSARPAQPGA